MAATMKDVAECAGLSLGTVSNYFTGKTNVSSEKKDRIEDAIKKLGYKVNFAARTLRTNSYKCIGVLIPAFRNVYLVRVIGYIEEILNKNGYSMLVLSYNNNSDDEKELLLYLSQRVDGILLVPSCNGDHKYVGELQNITPVITFDEATNNIVSDRVLVNNADIVEKAINMLFEKRHKKIGIIAGPANAYTTMQRLQGYKESHKINNIEIDNSLITYGDYSKTSGENACTKLINEHSDMTAIFVVGYRMTLGVLASLIKNNSKDKISVVGYDASDIQDILNNQISYIYQPYEKIANNLVKLILRRVSNDYKDFPKTIKIDANIRNMDLIN